jgi:very-short-patch-repair endonuclease
MNHTLLLPFIVLFIAGVVAIFLRKNRRPKTRERWPLRLRPTVLSQPEQILYRRLVQSLPQHLVFPQVQLSRFLDVERGVPRQTWFNRISQLSADFLILHPDTSVLAAIELDDASHASASRRDADARKTHALQSAGVRLIRWHVKSLPNEVAIRTVLTEAEARPPIDRS